MLTKTGAPEEGAGKDTDDRFDTMPVGHIYLFQHSAGDDNMSREIDEVYDFFSIR